MATMDLQKTLMLVAVKRTMESLDRKRSELSITQIDLSREAGLKDNAFSKNLSEMEDISLSRFINYWCTMARIAKDRGQKFTLNETSVIMPENVQRIADLAGQVSAADLNALSVSEMKLLVSLHNDIKTLYEKKSISDGAFELYKLLYDQYSLELTKGSADDE